MAVFSITVVICFHFSIFEVSETSLVPLFYLCPQLWFAFILVSLKYRKHLLLYLITGNSVVICFHFSIFEVSETSANVQSLLASVLWFAFILVSLKYRKHPLIKIDLSIYVVICFHFSIFEVSETSLHSVQQMLS